MTARLIAALSALAVAIAVIHGQSGPFRLPIAIAADAPTEAPASFQLVTNGFTSQEDFLANLAQFSEDAVETGDDEGGLGPTFNATSCIACHRNPSPGGGMSRFELRAGKLALDGSFISPPGGTLVRQLAVDPAAQQRAPEGFFTTKRRSTSLFGLGYIEVIRDNDILAFRDSQPVGMRGVATLVPATTGIQVDSFEEDGGVVQVSKVGRFGWKCQEATLLDFASNALEGELSRTNPIRPVEPLAVDGRSLSAFKKSADPEDAPTTDAPFGQDTTAYARFMRALQAPPRDFTLSETPDAKAGQQLFAGVGCAVCHRPDWTTAAAGSTPTGLQPVDGARGGKVIHPYSDFLLHDIGTGQTEVVQGGPASTRTMLRTAPLWGVRTVPEMGHDGRWTDFEMVIQGHGGQAATVRGNYNALTPGQKAQLKTFLLSL